MLKMNMKDILSMWTLDNASNCDKWWKNTQYRCTVESSKLSDVVNVLNQLLGNDYYLRRDMDFFSDGVDSNPFGYEYSILSHGKGLGAVTRSGKYFYVNLSQKLFESIIEEKFSYTQCAICSAPFPSSGKQTCESCVSELVNI